VTNDWDRFSSKLVRFDCALSQDIHDPEMKKHRVNHEKNVYFKQGLSKEQKERILRETEALHKNK